MDKYGFPILNINDPDFVQQFRAAIGVGPNEPLVFVTPQFERTDGTTPASGTGLDWSVLSRTSELALMELGLRKWDAPDANGMVLWLFPGEWYNYIPNGFEVVDINDERKLFQRGRTDGDIRYGMLAYGIKRKAGG